MTMPSIIESSAPGKVILFGEYAVLEGAPSMVLAVDRRARVQLEQISQDASEVQLHCPGFLDQPQTLTWNNDQQLQHQNPSLQLLLTLCNGLLSKRTVTTLRADTWLLTVDTRELYSTTQKLGLGSSAALTVALAGLLRQLNEQPLPADKHSWLELHRLHSLAQGKQGSGIDIAASLLGGASRFINRQQQRCELETCTLPGGLQIAFVWTGQSASTAQYLGSLSHWRRDHPKEYAQHMASLNKACEQAFAELHCTTSFLAALDAFTEVLQHFAQSSQLPIFANGHQVLYDLAATQPQVIYKPCGAGGGDLGVALSDNADSLASFVAKIAKHGFTTIDLKPDNQGMRCIAKADL